MRKFAVETITDRPFEMGEILVDREDGDMYVVARGRVLSTLRIVSLTSGIELTMEYAAMYCSRVPKGSTVSFVV